EVAVEQVDARVGKWAAKREGGGNIFALLLPRLVSYHADRRFGWAVVIKSTAVRSQPTDLVNQLPAQRLAAKHEAPTRKDLRGSRVGHQGCEMGGNQLEAVDRMAVHVLGHRRRVGRSLLRDHVKTAARAQSGVGEGVAQIGRKGRNDGVA